MFTGEKATHDHVNNAIRSFAKDENLTSLAKAIGYYSPQVLRNKLCLSQPHQLTVNELVDITLASNNRCIIDGVLFQLGCLPTQVFSEGHSDSSNSITNSLLKICSDAGSLSELTLEIRDKQGVTEFVRHDIVKQAMVLMAELRRLVMLVDSKAFPASVMPTYSNRTVAVAS